MYSPKISQEMVEKLYCLREELAKTHHHFGRGSD